MARLETRPAPKVVLLLGQAAQGKTTLAAAYIDTVDSPVAWIDLDRAAADPANLYYLLVRALDHADLLREPDRFLEKPVLALGPGEGAARWQARLQALFVGWQAEGLLVIDGLEHLPRASASFDLLQTLLDHQPIGLRLLLLSRREPRLKFQQLSVRRQALVIPNAELAFTPTEIETFFKQVLSMVLRPAEVRRLEAMTGGWVGGLVLLSAVLARIPADRRSRYLVEEAPAQLSGDALRFFSETVFTAQPEAIQTFLLRSAVLDGLSVADASRLCDVGNAQPFIEELMQRHLFIQAFEQEDGRRLYRYNHLFHAFLRVRLAEQTAPEEVNALEERAGDLYWEHGATENAIAHYLRAGRQAKAAAGVKKIGLDLFIRGRQTDLAAWLERLTDRSVNQDPWLRLLRVLSRRIHGGHHNQEDLAIALNQFRAERDRRGELLALAFLIESGVFLGTDVARQMQWMDAAESLMAEMKGTLHYLFARTMLWLQVGIGRIVGGYDVERGCAACRKAVLLAEQMGDDALRLNAMVGLALGEIYRGDFDAAKKALSAAADSDHCSTYPEYRILDRLVRIELAIQKGAHQDAGQRLEHLKEEIESFGLIFLYPVYLDLCGWLAIGRKDARQALQFGYQLGDVAALAANPIYEGLALRMMALANYHLAHHDLAHRQVTMASRRWQQSASQELYKAQSDLIFGLTLRRKGDGKTARTVLNRLLRQAWVRRGQPNLLAEAHLAMALVHHDAAKRDAAAAHLRAAWTLLTDGERSAFLFLSGADVGELDRLLKADSSGESHSAATAVEAAAEAPAMGTPTPTGAAPIAVAAGEQTIPLMNIHTFGGLSVTIAGRGPILDRQWGGRLPKLLLKAVIVHGLRDIPKEILTESLWPEADPTAAGRNFKVTLHRLRKVLEPDLERGVRSAYLHLHEGRISLDPDHCRVDVPRFLDAAKKIRTGGTRLEVDALLGLCGRARRLYRGDFLPEEPYAPWAEMKRLALRDTYLQVTETEARLLIQQGQFKDAADGFAELLQRDPCLEAAAQALMELYARLGRRGDALRVYQAFADALMQQLGALPDTRTQLIYQQIQAGDAS